ncbi:MAG: winged helix-turn-helix transcriptional regulator [Deltaproteobacteria bacterium]|nr:winged helix-turn-helix transcriptional regulator [Deltaproteobacteria bacterium]
MSQKLITAPPSNDQILQMATRLRVLGEPLRLRLVHQLLQGEFNVTALSVQLGTTQPNISKHLKVLQQNGIVTRRTHKSSAFYGIADRSVVTLCDTVRTGLGISA